MPFVQPGTEINRLGTKTVQYGTQIVQAGMHPYLGLNLWRSRLNARRSSPNAWVLKAEGIAFHTESLVFRV